MRPPVVAGGLTAVVAGGLMAALTASSGGLAGSVPAIVALTVPLVVAGVAYGWLVDGDRLQGRFGPGIIFWSAALPVARLTQELSVGGGPPENVAGFLVYQALVGGAFGLGFLLLHGQMSAWLAAGGAKAK